MRKIAQISILIVCMFVALPLSAQIFEAEGIAHQIETFLKEKQVTITNGSYALIREDDAILPRDSVMTVQFVCKGEKPLKKLLKAFEDGEHWAEIYRSYIGRSAELTRALRAVIGPRGKGQNNFFALSDNTLRIFSNILRISTLFKLFNKKLIISELVSLIK